MSSAVLVPASFAILLAGARLFTNATEWFGGKLNLRQSAVGSVLAAVATALPEKANTSFVSGTAKDSPLTLTRRSA